MKSMHWALVVDNNDTELQAGRIKIKIPYIHGEVSDDLLPWAKQMCLFSGGSSSHGSSYIPEKDSYVWVIFENELDYLKPFYIADVQLNGMNPHLLFANNVASKITGFTSAYPDVKFKYYANGISTGVSSNKTNPEMFMYHPKGTSIFIDKEGLINITDAKGNKIVTSATGISITDKNNCTIVSSSTGIKINDNLEVLK